MESGTPRNPGVSFATFLTILFFILVLGTTFLLMYV